MCDYCFPPHNPPQVFTTEATSVAGAYPSIAPAPPGVPVNALAATQILIDLIAELRERHHLREHCGCCCVTCEYADVMDPCPEAAMADRAEARLREVGGDAGV